MDIIFLGYCVNEKTAETLSGISIAGNKMQLSILINIKEYVRNLDITTVYPVASFPADRKIFYGRENIKLTDCLIAKRVPFLNISLFKQISQVLTNYKIVKRLIKEHKNAILLTFNMYPQIGLPAVWIKKKYGNRIVTLLADLPIDDNYARNGIAKWIYQYFNRITEKLLKQIDGAIVLNKKAWEIYAPQAKYLVMEGGYDRKESNEIERSVGKKLRQRRNIVYGGSLNEYSGVQELVEAMNFVEDTDIELDIYGNGYLKDYVKSRCGDRIHYCGSVTNKEMIKVQQDAWVLINPRPVDDPIAMVTFPSKIFEYMASGTPVISTRLNGFLSEYEGLLIFAESSDPREMARCINGVSKCSYEDILNMAERAKRFVVQNKSWVVQTRKIVNFIEEQID